MAEHAPSMKAKQPATIAGFGMRYIQVAANADAAVRPARYGNLTS